MIWLGALTWLAVGAPQLEAEADRIVHRVSVVGGLDAAPQVGLGYDLRIVDAFAGRDVDVHAQYRIPVPGLSLDDFRLDAGAEVDLLKRGPLRWTFDTTFSLVRLHRRAFIAHGIQLALATRLGVYWRVPGLRFDVVWDPNLATHVEPSPAMRRFNPDVRDGWYSSLGMAFKLGAAALVRLGPVDLEVHGGLRMTARTSLFSAGDWLVGYIPFYMGVQAGYRF